MVVLPGSFFARNCPVKGKPPPPPNDPAPTKFGKSMPLLCCITKHFNASILSHVGAGKDDSAQTGSGAGCTCLARLSNHTKECIFFSYTYNNGSVVTEE